MRFSGNHGAGKTTANNVINTAQLQNGHTQVQSGRAQVQNARAQRVGLLIPRAKKESAKIPMKAMCGASKATNLNPAPTPTAFALLAWFKSSPENLPSFSDLH
jgi:hypothetical protein